MEGQRTREIVLDFDGSTLKSGTVVGSSGLHCFRDVCYWTCQPLMLSPSFRHGCFVEEPVNRLLYPKPTVSSQASLRCQITYHPQPALPKADGSATAFEDANSTYYCTRASNRIGFRPLSFQMVSTCSGKTWTHGEMTRSSRDAQRVESEKRMIDLRGSSSSKFGCYYWKHYSILNSFGLEHTNGLTSSNKTFVLTSSSIALRRRSIDYHPTITASRSSSFLFYIVTSREHDLRALVLDVSPAQKNLESAHQH